MLLLNVPFQTVPVLETFNKLKQRVPRYVQTTRGHICTNQNIGPSTLERGQTFKALRLAQTAMELGDFEADKTCIRKD